MIGKRWDPKRGRQYRDIGIYTIIPTMMIVGPVIGYVLGHLAEKRWGHEPWLSVGGALFGLAAAARQIWIILKNAGRR
jgi:F0F1-type ATP synthase assembly protein I